MSAELREGSTWQRNPPMREVVRIERIWVYYGVPTVRAHPIHGGRPLVAPIEWLYENFTEVRIAHGEYPRTTPPGPPPHPTPAQPGGGHERDGGEAA